MIRAVLLRKIFSPVVELPLDVCGIISVMAAHAFKADCVRLSRENWDRRCIFEEELAVTRVIKRIKCALSQGLDGAEFEFTRFEDEHEPSEFNTGDDILHPAGLTFKNIGDKLYIDWSQKRKPK